MSSLSVFSFFALFCLSFCLFYFLTALSLCSHKMTYISITKVRVMPLRCQWWQEHYTIALDWCSVDEMDAKKVMHLSWLKGDIAFFWICDWQTAMALEVEWFKLLPCFCMCVCFIYTQTIMSSSTRTFFFFNFLIRLFKIMVTKMYPMCGPGSNNN